MKFSLGAFANRHSTPAWQSDIDLDIFGEIFDPAFHGIYLDLTSAGIQNELARKFVGDVIPILKANPDFPHTAHAALTRALSGYLKFEPDLLGTDKPLRLAAIGATGVGKTTTIAKIAAIQALRHRRPVEQLLRGNTPTRVRHSASGL